MRPQLDWLTMTPTAPPSRTLHLYQRMQRWPWGKWRFMRTASERIPMLTTLRAQLQELRVGLCRAMMSAHRHVRTVEGGIDPIAIGALAQLAASMVIEVSVPEGVHWNARGLTIEHLQAPSPEVVAVARLDKIDWGQAGLVGVPVTVSDGQGKEVARAVISFAVAARND
jgi:acyl-coenzyme A thioesterase PaaI-like protein